MIKNLNKSLLPDFLKQPIIVIWLCVIPQLILIFINGFSYWLISDEVLPARVPTAYMIFVIQWGLLFMSGLIYLNSRLKQTQVGLLWCLILFITHIGYLWYVSVNLWSVIPTAIEPWILDNGSIILHQYTFMMPGLFYVVLRLACFDFKIKGLSDFSLSLILTILAPLTNYFFFLGFERLSRAFAWKVPWVIVTLFFVAMTGLAFLGLIRLFMLSYHYVRSRGNIFQFIFSLLLAVVGPILGLVFNRQFPFPANFQSEAIYILAIINGLIVMLPNFRNGLAQSGVFFARGVMFPFTLYFFLVFLPFLPLSLPAIFAFGLGFLILVPTVLCLLHMKRLSDDFKIYQKNYGLMNSTAVLTISLLLIPGFFVFQSLQDKANLKSVLDYVYAPDYQTDSAFSGSIPSVKRVLIHLKKNKSGLQLPILSGVYNRVVFEGMVLPDKKIEYLYRLFFAEDINDVFKKDRLINRGFDGLWRNQRLGVQRVERDRNVALTAYRLERQVQDGIVAAKLHLDMRSLSDTDTAEFFRQLIVPESVLITDFQLKVNDEMVPGRIFEKRAALWVYRMIRDFTRRDPGLLVYQSPERIDFSVYPFLKDQSRQAMIELSFPQGLEPVIQFGDETILLNDQPVINETFYVTQFEPNKAVLIISERKLKQLSTTSSQTYFHFILDDSSGTKSASKQYLKQMRAVIDQYGQNALNRFRVTLAHYDMKSLTPSLVDFDQLESIVKKADFDHSGGLNIERVMKYHWLEERPTPRQQDLAIYPTFVVIGHSRTSILEFGEMDFFQMLSPYENEYFISRDIGHIEKKSIWSQSQSNFSQQSIKISLDEEISIIPAKANEPLFVKFSGDFDELDLKFFNPTTNQFDSVGDDMKKIKVTTRYAQGLKLNIYNTQALHHPKRFEKSLADILKTSKDLNVMTPSTSFIVVERSSQWKMLKVKERQRLKTSSGLAFEDSFETPAPSMWMILIVLGIWYGLRQRKFKDERK